jgi:hypothetical protein
LDSTLPPDYPSELLWNGREPNQNFAPDEFLYYRVKDFDLQGKVSPEYIQCPDMSVNRGTCSQPIHVLYAKLPRYLHYKVAQFQVSDIPSQTTSDDGQVLDFRIVHDPTVQSEDTDENFSHSEIRGFRGGERRIKIPSTARKQYQMRLRSAMIAAPVGG